MVFTIGLMRHTTTTAYMIMNATHAMNDSDAAAISAAANRNDVGSDELKPPFTTPIRTILALTARFVIQNSVAAPTKANDI